MKKRLMRYAWAKWRDAIEMRIKERSIIIPRDQQLLRALISPSFVTELTVSRRLCCLARGYPPSDRSERCVS